LLSNAALSLPERHLGLTVATELPDAMARLDAAADALQATPLGQMDDAALQRWAVPFPAPAVAETTPRLLAGQTLAVARDAAFCFIYQANLDTLRALGAELAFFSPLADGGLPPCDALWIPGGYPELHADALAGNRTLRDSVHAHVAAGKPVWAECGGMMALLERLVASDGANYPMWGVMPGTATMSKRLAALGPQQLALESGTLRGHTFHYSSTASSAPVVARTARPHTAVSADAGEAVYRCGSVQASYFHAWFPSSPRATAALFARNLA
jgi:cobyrinic acid a,c-diamide synthase